MTRQAGKNWPIARRLAFHTEPPNADGCTLWMAYRNAHGYGVMRHGESILLAHRVAWAEANGPIPEGMVICHRCDVPACVNTEHLFLGTNQDNVDDRGRKGRTLTGRGTRHWSAKLTEDQVRAIRADARQCGPIATEYGVSDGQVSAIKTRRKWAWLPD